MKLTELTEQQRNFLMRLDTYHGEIMTRQQLPNGSDRDEDKARQWCRRHKLAEYVGPVHGVKKNGWRITAHGALLLRGHEVGSTK